ncbi:MAG: ATP-binding cassette domain-containing protein [Clostridiales Family XIII bacterium]|nr:ATP-binding cassette domain-containing protein [Clostridiales Family XIII bacterium]
MLTVEHVFVNYGKSRVVSDVSFSIADGGKLAVLGRNGVGKTTLMKALIGLLPVEAGGRVLLDGADLTKRPAWFRNQAGIGYVPQGREIIPDMTAEENLELGAMGRKDVDAKAQKEVVLSYFPALGELLKRKGGVLSGGQQQQLAIGRCLMGKPSLILLDEPTEGIQPNVVAEMARILNRIASEMGIGLCLVEQNLGFARRIAENYVIIQKGQVVSQGAMEALDSEEANRYLSV